MVILSQLRRAIMRAVRVHQFGAPEVMKVEKDLPLPVPGDTQVLIKVQATGVNPVDTYIRSGNYARLPALPYTPGSDAAGIVEAVGEKVTNFKKGDRAYTVRSVSGAYAEYCVAEEMHTGRLSEKLSFSQGAGLGVPYFTAYRALVLQSKLKAGETVLVHGASGAVGLACLQIAKNMGAQVVGTAGTPEGMELVKKLGADHVFNHREDGYTDKIVNATGGAGADITVEMLANVNLQKDLEMAKMHGRIAIVGNRGNIEINPRVMMGKELQVMGILLMAYTPEQYAECHSFVWKGAEDKWLAPHVCRDYPLEQAPASHTDIMDGSGTQGKLVLTL